MAVIAVRESADAPTPTALDASVASTSTTAPALAPTTVVAPTEVSPQDLRHRIDDLATELARTRVVIRTDLGEATLTVADLGIALESEATFQAVRELRSAGAGAGGVSTAGWSALPTDPQLAERRYRVDRSAARIKLASTANTGVTATPPSIIVVNKTLATDFGEPGETVDADAVVDQVLEGVARSLSRIVVEADLDKVKPLVKASELGQAVDAAHDRYGSGVVVAYNGHTHEITIETVADWLVLDYGTSPLLVTLDESAVALYLEKAFSAQSSPPATASMAVVNGVPTVVASDGSVACCADDVGSLISEALLARIEGPLALPSRPAVSREEQAYLESLGIIELVATFTTKHACCQGRVENIHRFADLMRGAIVESGQSLSLNAHVGRRTKQKGFVEGGFIERGVLVDDIGGGVSQFATTIFNSLIRAGMTIDEYQTHSLYLSRYPFGLDPTISYPKPDLRFTNPTPYGLLIWPRYTGTTITVDLYSTRNVEATIGKPRETMQDFCRRVRTDVTRVFADGRVETDTFHARYRPEQGRNCDGSRSVPRQCVDPLLTAADSDDEGPAESGAETELVDDSSERSDGSVVECPPLECTEKPGDRGTEEPRYSDDPCLNVDLNDLALEDADGADSDGQDDSRQDRTDNQDDDVDDSASNDEATDSDADA